MIDAGGRGVLQARRRRLEDLLGSADQRRGSARRADRRVVGDLLLSARPRHDGRGFDVDPELARPGPQSAHVGVHQREVRRHDRRRHHLVRIPAGVARGDSATGREPRPAHLSIGGAGPRRPAQRRGAGPGGHRPGARDRSAARTVGAGFGRTHARGPGQTGLCPARSRPAVVLRADPEGRKAGAGPRAPAPGASVAVRITRDGAATRTLFEGPVAPGRFTEAAWDLPQEAGRAVRLDLVGQTGAHHLGQPAAGGALAPAGTAPRQTFSADLHLDGGHPAGRQAPGVQPQDPRRDAQLRCLRRRGDAVCLGARAGHLVAALTRLDPDGGVPHHPQGGRARGPGLARGAVSGRDSAEGRLPHRPFFLERLRVGQVGLRPRLGRDPQLHPGEPAQQRGLSVEDRRQVDGRSGQPGQTQLLVPGHDRAARHLQPEEGVSGQVLGEALPGSRSVRTSAACNSVRSSPASSR